VKICIWPRGLPLYALPRLLRRLQFVSLPKRLRAERCPSGLRSTLGKRVLGKLNRGFESHPLRHIVLLNKTRSS
jgi:hypothetical protein